MFVFSCMTNSFLCHRLSYTEAVIMESSRFVTLVPLGVAHTANKETSKRLDNSVIQYIYLFLVFRI